MVENGIIREDEPLELLNGELTLMSPQGIAHGNLIAFLTEELRYAFDRSFGIYTGAPLQLDGRSLPEPDVAVVSAPVSSFIREARRPTGRDAVLVIEVAWSSQTWDRKKARVYARGGVPAYWLIDLAARRIEVYTQPGEDGRYQTVQILTEGDDITVPVAGFVWEVADLLPPERG